MPENEHPNMPQLSLAEAAIGLHEFFISLTSAGFSEEQAMYLVAEVLATQARGGDYVDEEYL